MIKTIVGREPTVIASVARIVVVIAGIGGVMLSLDQATLLATAAYLLVEIVTTRWNRARVSPVGEPALPYEATADVIELSSRRPPPSQGAA